LAPSTVVATAEDGFFLDAAITVLYGNEEAFLFLADRRNIINNSVQLPVSSSIGTMGVSANITSLPQPVPIILPQTTDHSTDQVPFNITTSGSNSDNTGNNSTYFPVQIGSSLDQMHTPHQMVGIASDITVNSYHCTIWK
jgi:hypothetical protein